jgi:hypothetical protein
MPSPEQMELRSRKIVAGQEANGSPGPAGAAATSSRGSPSKTREDAPGTAPSSGLARTGKLLFFAMGIWTCFINWGIVQQRITTFGYKNVRTQQEDRWTHMVVANSKSRLITIEVLVLMQGVQGDSC